MKLPRDESADGLIRRLNKIGYHKTRQSGSHIRLTRISNIKTDHITIPNHRPIKVGTLSEILHVVSAQLGATKSELIQQLYSNQ